MLTRDKYKRLTDLFVVGRVLELPDGEVMWLQALNPWEKNEAIMDGQTARSRTALAVSVETSQEYIRLRAKFEEFGPEGCVEEILSARTNRYITRIALQLRQDDEWSERASLLERVDDLSTNATEEEQANLVQIAADYAEAIQTRLNDRLEAERYQLSSMSTEDLWDEFKETYIENVGGTAAMAEYRLAEIAYSARVCAAVKVEGGWDHAECENHSLHVFASKEEVKGLPERLLHLLVEGVAQVSMDEVEAKNSDRQQGSSQSSLLPNGEGESTPSTQTVTLPQPPGSLSQPSPMP